MCSILENGTIRPSWILWHEGGEFAMTVEEAQLVDEREQLLDELEGFLVQYQGPSLYPDDLVREFEKKGKSEGVILSAVWRLIDEHRIDLNERLAIITASPAK
jgi:hypothetical protein